jgi:nucleotide-binding universal stress UspA family protein
MKLRKILVPIDYSDHSYQALRWGASLAEQYGAQLLLLHVLPRATEHTSREVPTNEWVPYRYYPDMGAGTDLFRVDRIVVDLVEEARTRLYDLAAKDLPRTLAIDVRVGIGRPAAEILQVAAEGAVDLIVMGTHGRTGLSHALLGSVAEKVMRTAPCPVFTIRAGVQAPL